MSPNVVTQEFCDLANRYGCYKAVGDKYGSMLTKEMFGNCDMPYAFSEKDRTAIYLSALPTLRWHAVSLPSDNPRLVDQLCNLRRHITPAGKDTVDHPSNKHDDVSNAVCGAIDLIVSGGVFDWQMKWIDQDRDEASLKAEDGMVELLDPPPIIPGTNGANFDNPILAASGTRWVPDHDGEITRAVLGQPLAKITSEVFWGDPKYRNTPNNIRWMLWDQGGGRGPCPPDARGVP